MSSISPNNIGNFSKVFDMNSPASNQPSGEEQYNNNIAPEANEKINFGQANSRENASYLPLNHRKVDACKDRDISQDFMQLISQCLDFMKSILLQLLQRQQAGDDCKKNFKNLPTDSGCTPNNNKGMENNRTTSTTNTPSSLSPSNSGDLHLPEAMKPYESDIRDASRASGIPASVLAAQIWQESRGNLNAVSTNGGNGLQDTGLMQLNPNTFNELKNKYPDKLGPNANPNNVHDNIMAGALYMKDQVSAFGGNIGAALRAYNSGPLNVNVNDLHDISKYGTGDATYVDKVMKFSGIISSGKGTLPA